MGDLKGVAAVLVLFVAASFWGVSGQSNEQASCNSSSTSGHSSCSISVSVSLNATSPQPPALEATSPSPPAPEGGLEGGRSIKEIVIGIIIGIVAGIINLVLSLYWLRKQIPILLKKRGENSKKVDNFVRTYEPGPKKYNFVDVKKMTNSFKDELGKGGFGTVYKGLLDGHPVAVKVLAGAKGNGEDFINEVASIDRTEHVNIVTLLGFCSEDHKRALIYEFMPNGSLEKFIFTNNTRTSQDLGWEKLYQIAVGIARGLEYLHYGCKTRILHLDIKPQNILLDEDFCPKISDFGLAKLCPPKQSVISMSEPRGTLGYIAPEVYCRNVGVVSLLSDVYSYGMMVLEMVGRRKNIEAGVESYSKIYFPHWIHRRLDRDEDLELGEHLTKEEEEFARKMIIVGLWCIQLHPRDRPTMKRVLEMLEGRLEGLQKPPKPMLSSPSNEDAPMEEQLEGNLEGSQMSAEPLLSLQIE